MNRRTFLKLASMGSVAFAAGCTPDPEKHLYTLVNAPDDMVSGHPTWYATACRECPAGCGILAKNREGRVIKLEGNPLHPVNQGALCIRGQAALQGLYNPDRLTAPLLKTNGKWRPIHVEYAQSLIREKAHQAASNGAHRIGLITEMVGQTQLDLFSRAMRQFNCQGPLIFEPLACEALKFAQTQVFGRPMAPGLHLDLADAVFGFGADFLETWISPVEYARQFKTMHGYQNGQKGFFAQVSPLQTVTGANADLWLACRPGTEAFVALGLIGAVLAGKKGVNLPQAMRDALESLSRLYPPEVVERLSGVSMADQERLGWKLMAARRPVILGCGASGSGPSATAAELAVLLLNLTLDSRLALFDYTRRHRIEISHTRADIRQFFNQLDSGPMELVLLNQVNPVYALPNGAQIAEQLSRPDRFVVAFSPFMDETAAAADLILPVKTPLESWDAYESKHGLITTMQPAMGKINNHLDMGDFLLNLPHPDSSTAKKYKPWLMRTISDDAPQHAWLSMLQRGGYFPDRAATTGSAPTMVNTTAAVATLAQYLNQLADITQAPCLIVAPSSRFFDGRSANRPWLNETPDAITQIAWQSTALIHPDTAAAHQLTEGDIIQIHTPHGSIDAPVYPYAGILTGCAAIAMGQGHSAFGRYAKQQGTNPIPALPQTPDTGSGAPGFIAAGLDISKTGRRIQPATTSGSRTTIGRKITPVVSIDAIGQKPGPQGLTMNTFPLALPIPEGYDRHRDIYPPHDHDGYRWTMVVDMDRCIGCGACVVACYAENNIGVVGEQRMVEGREMAWLQIQRYQDSAESARMTFLPMMCQHCDNAPCEAVCPVYAPHHSKEGLNNQIYNRCIGTRFCAQNCPYKVRRFNWFDWPRPEPLPMQLNPNVTVRSKGVMEKCSFCIQRIKDGHNLAKNENRAIRDGEVTPACAQTCPTGALTFGSLMDPDSQVRQLAADPRAYQVLGYLNTKPAVIYLKKVVHAI